MTLSRWHEGASDPNRRCLASRAFRAPRGKSISSAVPKELVLDEGPSPNDVISDAYTAFRCGVDGAVKVA